VGTFEIGISNSVVMPPAAAAAVPDVQAPGDVGVFGNGGVTRGSDGGNLPVADADDGRMLASGGDHRAANDCQVEPLFSH
jgi:hypothetical protein